MNAALYFCVFFTLDGEGELLSCRLSLLTIGGRERATMSGPEHSPVCRQAPTLFCLQLFPLCQRPSCAMPLPFSPGLPGG